MIEGLKPYAEYKESDIPWAPVIPSTWQTERAKRLFTKMQRPVRPEDDVVTCFRDGMVTLRKNRRLRGFTEATVFSGYQGIRKGDLVIHGMDAFAGAIGVSDSDGKGTPVYNVCKPSPGVVASYYAHTVREMSRSQWILALAKGIRERSTDFRYEMFGNQIVPLPPPDEQAAIVRFLDHANRKIDGFIRAKRKLIGLLNEQKQAIIHRAVTGKDEVRMVKDENGNSSFILQPSTLPKKPSGIPWLGDIPMHWEARAFARMSRVVRGSSPRPAGDKRFFHGDFMPWVTVGEVTKDREMYLKATDSFLTKMGAERSTMFPAGTLILTNSGATLGVPKILEINACANDGIVAFLGLRPLIQKPFAYLFLSTLTQRLRDEMRQGGTQPNLNTGIVRRIVCPVPPIAEQEAILKYLEHASAPLTTAIARTEREIALMQEYRTRLTADLVTGKLDVREAAAHLPAPPSDAVTESTAEEPLEDIETEETA